MLTGSESYNEYISRIQNVIKFISENISENLNLNSLSEAAYFSPFHFHRIFSAIVKETPLDFVKRVRLEKAANMLIHNKSFSITEICYDCGFSSPAVFSRSFKNHFGKSATEWKKENIKKSKNSKTGSKKSKADFHSGYYFENINFDFQNNTERTKMNVEVKNISKITVAYAANLEGYKTEKIAEAWERITKWAYANRVIGPASKFIGISFDNPDITPRDKCRYYACISINDNTEVSNGIGKLELKEGRYGVYRFKGGMTEIEQTYKNLYGSWLPESGYQPDDHPCYEIYYKNPDSEPIGIVEMDIFIPLKPL